SISAASTTGLASGVPPVNVELPPCISGTVVPVTVVDAACVDGMNATMPATVATATRAINRRFLTFGCLITPPVDKAHNPVGGRRTDRMVGAGTVDLSPATAPPGVFVTHSYPIRRRCRAQQIHAYSNASIITRR